MSEAITSKLESIISGHKVNADDADWLRAALSQPAPLAGEVMDALLELVESHKAPYPSEASGIEAQDARAIRRTDALEKARAILALRPQAVPMKDDSQRLDWLATNPACTITEDSGLWFFRGHGYAGLREAIDAARGITAKAEGGKP